MLEALFPFLFSGPDGVVWLDFSPSDGIRLYLKVPFARISAF